MYWGGERYSKVRLFRKGFGSVETKPLHEGNTGKREIGELTNKIHHHSYRSPAQLFGKLPTMRGLKVGRKKDRARPCHSLKLFLYAPHMFFARYVKEKGYKDGWRGLILHCIVYGGINVLAIIMKCICDEVKVRKLFSSGNCVIARCTACTGADGDTKGISRKQVYQAEDVTIYIEKEQIFRRLFADVVTFIRQFKTSGTLIDIGAGVGLLVDEAKIAGFDAIGFEPSKEMVKAAKKEFGIELILKIS